MLTRLRLTNDEMILPQLLWLCPRPCMTFIPECQVVHGEGRVSRDLPGDLEEGREVWHQLVQGQGREGLQEDQAAAAGVAGTPEKRGRKHLCCSRLRKQM